LKNVFGISESNGPRIQPGHKIYINLKIFFSVYRTGTEEKDVDDIDDAFQDRLERMNTRQKAGTPLVNEVLFIIFDNFVLNVLTKQNNEPIYYFRET
jgi:hypothetical protein